MKTAQELRAGNVVMVGAAPMVVQKAEYHKSGRNASVVKMKLRNLLAGTASEAVYKADDKFEVVMLERKEASYSYFADPMYVFMDSEYNPWEVEKDRRGVALYFGGGGWARNFLVSKGAAFWFQFPPRVGGKIIKREPGKK